MRGYVSVAIVVLIVILTLGMLLPGIGRRRTDASRSYCQFNLHTLYKALDAYHGRQGALPQAVFSAPGLSPEERVSWMAAPLPFLKEDALYQLVDTRQGWAAPANKEALAKGTPRFQCVALVNLQESRSNNVAHYLGLAGVGKDAARLPLGHPRAGVFGYRREVTFDYIRQWDGASATILVMESGMENGPWLAGGPPTVRGLDPERTPYLGGAGQFGGTHAAGAHALFADGSVTLFTPDVAPRILEALVTLGGQEP